MTWRFSLVFIPCLLAGSRIVKCKETERATGKTSFIDQRRVLTLVIGKLYECIACPDRNAEKF